MSEIKKLRDIKGWSQAKLAEVVGCNQTQIFHLEKGRRKLTKEWAIRIAPHLDTTAEELMFPGLGGIISEVRELAPEKQEEVLRTFRMIIAGAKAELKF